MFIRKRGNKWQSQIRIVNRPCLSKSFKSRTDAKRWSIVVEQKMRREDAGIAHIKFPFFRDVATRYINEVFQYKRTPPEFFEKNNSNVNSGLAGILALTKRINN